MNNFDIHNMNYADEMLNLLMEIGEELICCNAEIRRVEDTMRRIGYAYGAKEMDVFAITSFILVTMIMPDGMRYTESRRIHGAHGYNFTKIKALNELSREYCSKPMAVNELRDRLVELNEVTEDDKNIETVQLYLGSALIGGSFAVFFGGSALDGIIGLLCGIVVCGIQSVMKRVAPNQLILQLLAAFFSGVLIRMSGVLLPELHVDVIMISEVMLLVPGVAMTNALKDVLTGDTLSGIVRLVETMIWAGALAVGFMVSMSPLIQF